MTLLFYDGKVRNQNDDDNRCRFFIRNSIQISYVKIPVIRTII